MERTEEDKLTQSPVKVSFGGKEYEIKPLPIKYSLPWVKKVVKVLVGIIPLIEITSDKEQVFADAFGEILVARPEQLIDLLFEYAKNLNRGEIEEIASSGEVIHAFEEVMNFERPLFGMVPRAFKAAMPEEDLAKLLNISSPSGIKTP